MITINTTKRGLIRTYPLSSIYAYGRSISLYMFVQLPTFAARILPRIQQILSRAKVSITCLLGNYMFHA
jgi:hypothetical protein